VLFGIKVQDIEGAELGLPGANGQLPHISQLQKMGQLPHF